MSIAYMMPAQIHLVLELPLGSFNENKAEPVAQQGYSVVEIALLAVSYVLPVLSR